MTGSNGAIRTSWPGAKVPSDPGIMTGGGMDVCGRRDAGRNMDDRELIWEEINTESIVRDEWIDFRQSAYRYPDGKVYAPFYTYSKKDYAVIVASDEDGQYICVRQFRQGIKEVTTEFPAGGIESADSRSAGENRREEDASECAGENRREEDAPECAGENRREEDAPECAGENRREEDAPECAGENRREEDALECARRELREETGYESSEWTHLLTIPSNATICDNYAWLFMARNCRKTGEQHLDETERLNVLKLSADQIEERIRTGDFQQAVHVLAWLLARRNR